ncbi:GTPase HflX [Marivirga atlantica]|uniref:GTPase HflX n=1 Tax=Marivirga atlantica TaxID=1548457 RepID=A0A937ABX1_9BACT|nr:GTPase HflX [Marivirga atlantica]MBL0763754.1 GTPase HflX [Marivirga atlantica]
MYEAKKIEDKQITAVLVALITRDQTEEKANEYLDELAFLTSTLGAETVKTYTQKLDHPDVKTFVGKGKLEEISAYIKAEQVDWIVFDDDLNPSQLRNLEKELKCKVYDRSLLILDIFLSRAQTAQAKTQVELARNQYLLPRLTRMWTHLERQRGGTATRGGAGEKEIETDRRNIRNTIDVLKKKLAKIDKQSRTQRKSRGKIVRVAIVGYTNVGKSTLMTMLSKSDILAENKLFATVDSTVRKVNFEDIPFLLSDTVGFIRKLPTHLIESFKSTLDEIREADILIHVVDVNHPSLEDHINVVNQTLADIDASDKPTLLVFNKVDLLEEEEELSVEEKIEQLKNTYLNMESFSDKDEIVFISATNKSNIEELRGKLRKLVEEKHFTIFPNYLKNTYY